MADQQEQLKGLLGLELKLNALRQSVRELRDLTHEAVGSVREEIGQLCQAKRDRGARLILAASELLEAAQAAEQKLALATEEHGSRCHCDFCCTVQQLRTAIDKATGEQS